MERLANILHLGIKELRSLQHDLALVILILWAFSMGVYSAATSLPESLHNAAIAVVDEDQSHDNRVLLKCWFELDLVYRVFDHTLASGTYAVERWSRRAPRV